MFSPVLGRTAVRHLARTRRRPPPLLLGDGALARLAPFSAAARDPLARAVAARTADGRRFDGRPDPWHRFLSTRPDWQNATDDGDETTPAAAKKVASTPNAPPAAPPVPASVSSAVALSSSSVSSALVAVQTSSAAVARAVWRFLKSLPPATVYYLTHPTAARERLAALWQHCKEEFHHYRMGSKLLVADVVTARRLVLRTLSGSSLTRRERKQLLRTTTDLFRLVPMSMFVLIPFMEFLLPVALKVFPNMLPSTFQDELKAEEEMKRQLQARLAMAGFFQETLQNLGEDKKKQAACRDENSARANDPDVVARAAQRRTAADFLEFVASARSGDHMNPEAIIEFSRYFRDELTLDNMSRMQLVNMCRYMNIPPYGADSLLVFQLRYRIRSLKEDDGRILWEGIDSLTKMELREACQERGMRSIGLSKKALRESLQQWLDLSVVKDVPISLLIMSRTFFLKEEMESRGPANADAEQSKSLSGLADAISGLDREVLNEVALDVATPEEIRSNDELLKIKLEVLQKENELIDTEFVARQAAKKKEEKERTEKERMEKKAVEEEQAEEKEAEEKEPGAEERFVPSEAEKTDFVHDGTAAVEEFDAPTEVFEDSRQLLEKTDGTTLAPPPAPAAETAVPEPEVAAEDDDDEAELSTEEIEALTHILTSDPVLKEREELARIKAAIAQDEENDEDEAAEDREEGSEGDPPSSPPAADAAGDGVEPGPEAAATEAPAESGAEDGNARLEHAIDKLSAKVRTMVDGIEEQLGEAELRIGDRLHLLDRDLDGILSRQEVEGVLQDVLKRKLTEQEASEIAREIDTDEDGRITVDELNKWCQMKRISKLVEVGRDVDNDMANMKEMDDEQAEAEATAKDSNDRETTAK